jgi:ring-1,2-phenylacetyl-CoA epoxidase subunit PaaD
VNAAGPSKEIVGRIWESLDRVMDPEIPAVSVVDMGMVADVEVDDGRARVVLLPTFTGCPAIPIIRSDVEQAVASVAGVTEVEVATTFSPPWTSDRITERGRAGLREFGLAPPEEHARVLLTEIGLPGASPCPFCGGSNTRPESAFGPTPCRAVYYCDDCRNPFERFKPV